MVRKRWPLVYFALAATLGSAALVSGTRTPALAKNCISHQPPEAAFTPPPDLPLAWECVTGGPLYGHERQRWIVVFKVTNTGQRRTQAFKLQANFVDAFGGVLRTLPIVENASLGNGDSDAAVWAFKPANDTNSLDHVTFAVLAVKFDDGTIWNASASPPPIGPAPDARQELRRYSITWDAYDMGSKIFPPTPSPSPSPSPSPTSR